MNNKKQLRAEYPHRIDEKQFKKVTQKELEKSNIKELEKQFGKSKRKNNLDFPHLEEMKEKYSKKEVIKFFKGFITKEKNGYEINDKMLDQLNETGRLVPVYGKKYSRQQLLSYFLESEPFG